VTVDFVSNEEIVAAARVKLHQGAWDYASGGAESETTLRRNRHAFDCVAFRPRILVDVHKVDTSTPFLGHQLRIPLLLAPPGPLPVFAPAGAVAKNWVRRSPARNSAGAATRSHSCRRTR